MPNCEMCGGDQNSLSKTRVSGAELMLCDECKDLGTVLEDDDKEEKETETKYSTNNGHTGSEDTNNSETEDSDDFFSSNRLVLDYGEKIREAREAAGYSISDVAERINEKESHLQKVEQEERQPDNNLQAKIEDFLSINLSMGESPSTGSNSLDPDDRRR